MTSEELERQVDEVVGDLCRTLPDANEDVGAVARRYSGRLCSDTTVNEFIPLLVDRYTKEHFRASRDDLHESA